MDEARSVNEFNSAICEAVGLDQTRVMWLTMRLRPGCAPSVAAEIRIGDDGATELINVIRRDDWCESLLSKDEVYEMDNMKPPVF